MALFGVENEVLRLGGYSMSLIEAVATLLYFVSVVLAMRPHVLTWPTGMIANVALLGLFYQVQLYSDMFLQCYFFGVSVYGWWQWGRSTQGLPFAIGRLSTPTRLRWAVISAISVLVAATVARHLHLWLPTAFPRPAAFPHADAFVAVSSVVATFLLARKRVENWWLWIAVDAVSVSLYTAKGVLFLATEHAVFLVLAVGGLMRWSRTLRARKEQET